MPFGRKKSLMDRAHDYVDQLSDQLTETVIPQLESAWEQAVEKAGPAISDAREKAQPLIEEGRTRASEAATAGATLAAAKSAEAREKAAPLLAARGESPGHAPRLLDQTVKNVDREATDRSRTGHGALARPKPAVHRPTVRSAP